MTSRSRKFDVSKLQNGIPLGGRCSVCHRPFEVELRENEALIAAHDRLVVMFNQHVCDEDANQAAARIVRETTE
jgi:hypothetical protein